MRRPLSLSLIAAAPLIIIPAEQSQASVPDHGSLSSTEVLVDPDVRAPQGFAVNVIQTETGFFRGLLAANGSVVKVQVHQSYDATISANRNTIYETDRWSTDLYSDGSSRQVGLTVHIKGPGGIVQLDAGQVQFNPDGTIDLLLSPA